MLSSDMFSNPNLIIKRELKQIMRESRSLELFLLLLGLLLLQLKANKGRVWKKNGARYVFMSQQSSYVIAKQWVVLVRSFPIQKAILHQKWTPKTPKTLFTVELLFIANLGVFPWTMFLWLFFLQGTCLLLFWESTNFS